MLVRLNDLDPKFENMKKVIILLTFCLVSLIATTPAHSQDATDAQINALLEAMESEKQFVTGIESMMEMQKESPQAAMLPDGFFEEYIKVAKTGYKTDLLPQFIEVYKNNLTAAEVSMLTEFYSTDVGKLLLEKMPGIQAEAMQIGMVWGQQKGMEIAQKLMSKE